VAQYLAGSGWLPGRPGVSFLAAGEYNENYLVEAGGRRYVFRVNHGSQLGLANQIEYEYRVLKAVAPSGVTPKPHFVDPDPAGLPGGVLLMDFLPGRALDYGRDLDKAARVLARVHALPAAQGLVVQAEPVADLAAESLGLIHRFPGHPLTEIRARLLDYHARVTDLHQATRELFLEEPLTMVNTEVNSGNFLISGERAFLVDWEKAVLSSRYQDLGHFLVATTTLWKTTTVLDRDQKRGFLDDYRRELAALGRTAPSLGELEQKTGILERTILLRALAWCFMAWFEYTQTERALQNRATLAKIESYLEKSRCFLG